MKRKLTAGEKRAIRTKSAQRHFAHDGEFIDAYTRGALNMAEQTVPLEDFMKVGEALERLLKCKSPDEDADNAAEALAYYEHYKLVASAE